MGMPSCRSSSSSPRTSPWARSGKHKVQVAAGARVVTEVLRLAIGGPMGTASLLGP